MRRSITDRIEQYIKVLINRSDLQQIEIQRAELAETFSCVPSQVTYVLSTRFSYKDGYITESRRGGKGFVRITRVKSDAGSCSRVQADIKDLIAHLKEDQHLGESEARLLQDLLFTLFMDLSKEQRHLVLSKLVEAMARYSGLQTD
ncbi:MAG TPA: transcriptional regulator [Syntrophomonas sp.]|nr:transcriptional regulator [Syntrophomonas sp.]